MNENWPRRFFYSNIDSMPHACNFFGTDGEVRTARPGFVGFRRIVAETAQRVGVEFRGRFRWQ